MRLTRRLAGLFFIGIVPLLFSGYAPWLLWVALAYDAVLVGLVLADQLLTPVPARAISIERMVDEKLSLGTDNKVTLAVRYLGDAREPFGFDLHSFQVKDEPPTGFEIVGSPTGAVNLSGTVRDAVHEYSVIPQSKGDFRFGDLYVLYDGMLGLISRTTKVPYASAVKVYPNLLETEKYDLLARKGRLMQVGIRALRLRGGGSEFESLREYIPGDEYRKIDWAATARRHKLISRQYEAERAQNIMLLIDAGRSMLQPVQKMAKLDYVINTAIMLAYVASSADDKVGLMVFDGEVRTYIPPLKGKAQVYTLMNALYNANAQMVESDYQAAFKELAALWRRRSLVLLFTDLIDPDSSSELLNAIPILEKLHRTVCVTVSDPNIIDAARQTPEVAAAAYRKAVAMQVLNERRQAVSILKRRGVWTIDSPPQSLSSDLINHYLTLKSRSAI